MLQQNYIYFLIHLSMVVPWKRSKCLRLKKQAACHSVQFYISHFSFPRLHYWTYVQRCIACLLPCLSPYIANMYVYHLSDIWEIQFLKNSIRFMPNVHHVTRRNLNILATIQASKRNDRQLKFATPPPYFPYFFFFVIFFCWLHLPTCTYILPLLKYVCSYIFKEFFTTQRQT